MRRGSYDYGYGYEWTDSYVYRREGYSTSVIDYHEHDFYEINLILSGNVRVLLADRAEEFSEPRIILTRPHTPHYISCRSDTLYSRLYLLFSHSFLADTFPEWSQVSAVFGKSGSILYPTAEQLQEIKALIEQIERTEKPLEKRLLIACLISKLSDLEVQGAPQIKAAPTHVLDAIAYIEEHYSDRIVSSEVAAKLHVGRTALLTAFKRYTEFTFGEYLTHCRLRHATWLLREGKLLDEIAQSCGFSDAGSLIRSFRRVYGTTPKKYLLQHGI